MIAEGEFQVKIVPRDTVQSSNTTTHIRRLTIEKNYLGELFGTSEGEMLSLITETEGSAGYVAIEQVVGTLDEKTGSFALQHYGLMKEGDNKLTLEVIPDSGEDELADISGKMEIKIEDGKHYYEFEYSFD